MELALSLINLFNSTTPGIAELLLLIKRKDGTITVAAVLDEADGSFDKNIQQAKDWLAAHPAG